MVIRFGTIAQQDQPIVKFLDAEEEEFFHSIESDNYKFGGSFLTLERMAEL
jgi:hypothetical protein